MGEPKLFTSTEAANFLGASPTSVKRWADEGELQCVRTLGGHRRFSRNVLEGFRQSRMGGEPSNAPIFEDDNLESWLDDLLSDRPHRVTARLFELRSNHESWATTCDALGVVTTAIGQAWVNGTISVVEEHLASERLQRALARVCDTLLVGPDAPRSLLLTLANEEHTLGLSLVEVALRELGWQTLWSGRRTPIEGLGESIDSQRIELLAVSASAHVAQHVDLAKDAAALADICRPRSVQLVLGGSGNWPEPPPYGVRLSSTAGLRHTIRKVG
ncbi:MAG: helix-turn-helix domain-containing protein [Sandaracinaceae bacterium]